MKFFNLSKKSNHIAPAHEQEIGGRVRRDWVMVLGVFSFLILVTVFVDGYLLVRINQGKFFAASTEVESTSGTLNRKTLLDVAAFFDVRQKEYEAFKSTTTPQIDPSL